MKRVLGLFVACFLIIGSIPVTYGQTSGPLTLQVVDTNWDEFPEVVLDIAVRDANGVPVSELTADAFNILEASISQPRPILDIQSQVNIETPLSLLLVIDISNSMRGQPLEDAKAAASRVVQQLGPNDQASIIAFEGDVDFDGLNSAREINFTSDKQALLSLIDALEAGEGTPLYDAIYKGVTWASLTDLGQRAVIVLTDGVDESDTGSAGSRVASSDIPILEAQRANLPIFTIGLGTQTDEGYLERVARTTGGTYQSAPSSDALEALFQNVTDLLKQVYVVRYQSAFDCDGQTHRVEVSVEANSRATQGGTSIGPVSNQMGCNPEMIPIEVTSTPVMTVTTDVPDASGTAVAAVPATNSTETPTLTDATPTAVANQPAEEASPSGDGWDVPWFYPVTGAGILAFVLGLLLYAYWPRPDLRPRCNNCGFVLGATDVSCPECGETRRNTGLKQ